MDIWTIETSSSGKTKCTMVQRKYLFEFLSFTSVRMLQIKLYVYTKFAFQKKLNSSIKD